MIMNASLRADETEHYVDLRMSVLGGGAPRRVGDASVNCIINGDLHLQAVYSKPDTSAPNYVYKPIGYYFNAELREGDVVTLEAISGDLCARATAIVPKAASLVSVDTVSVVDTPYYEGVDSYEFKVRISDIPDERTYMRLAMKQLATTVFDIGDDSEEHLHTTGLQFDFDDDSILRGNFHSNSERDRLSNPRNVISIPVVTNKYCIFSDEGFENSEYSPSLYLKKQHLWRPENPMYPAKTESKVKIDLLTLSEEEYRYIYAYTHAEANGSLFGSDAFAQILMEPVSFPSNVEGGLGLVTVAYVSSIELDLPTVFAKAANTRYSVLSWD